MMGKDEWLYPLGSIIAMLVAGLFMGALVSGILTSEYYEEKLEELGQSICEEEYNMDYKSYSKGDLTCKPKAIVHEMEYDGITIKIDKGGD